MASEEIVFEPPRERRPRSNPRVVKRKMSSYAVKRSHHRHWPQPTHAPHEAIEISTPTAA
jgi:hypothetical protein